MSTFFNNVFNLSQVKYGLKTVAGLLLLAAVTIPSSGCSDENLQIDEDFECGSKDCHPGLRSPYVRGVTIPIQVSDDRVFNRTDLTDWSLVSDDESVVTIVSHEHNPSTGRIDIVVETVGEGTTELLLLDGDEEVQASAEIDVREPTRVSWWDPVDRTELAADQPVRILVNARATFLVRYWDDETLLHGSGVKIPNGVLTGNALAITGESFVHDSEDYLQLETAAIGSIVIEYEVPGGGTQIELEGTQVQDIDSLYLVESSRLERTGVQARGFDANGERIYGVDATWSVDETQLDGVGDICLYTKSAASELQLQAKVGEQTKTITVEGKDPTVHSSNDLSCSVGSRDASGWGWLVFIALTCARRRRTGTRSVN